MTSSLLLHPFRVLAIAAALCCIGSASAVAQSPTDSQAAAKVRPYSPNLNARLDFDFPERGGSQMTPLKYVLDKFITEFRAAGNPVNVIYQDNASDRAGGQPAPEVMVAPISLRQVTFMKAMSALLGAATPAVQYTGSDDMLVLERSRRPNEQAQAPQPVNDFIASNIEEFLNREGKSKENRKGRLEILRKAITKAIALAEVETPKIELDDESGLLFLFGKSDSIGVVLQVINAATMDPSKPAPPAPPAPAAPANP